MTTPRDELTVSPEMSSIVGYLRDARPRAAATVAERRTAMDAQIGAALAPDTTEQLEMLGNRPVAWIAPAGRAVTRTVLYLHGGQFEHGSMIAYRAFVSRLAIALDARVALLEYSLAPEHPFPAAIDDTVAAHRELLDRGTDAACTVLVGDSAGGGLAAATLLAFHRAALAQPACAVLISPWADLTFTADAYRRCADTDVVLHRDEMERSATAYLGGADATDPLASPALAPLADLGDLAPLLLLATDAEMLVDDAITLAARVGEAGGRAELDLWPGLIHAWQLLPGIPEADAAVARVAAFVDEHL